MRRHRDLGRMAILRPCRAVAEFLDRACLVCGGGRRAGRPVHLWLRSDAMERIRQPDAVGRLVPVVRDRRDPVVDLQQAGADRAHRRPGADAGHLLFRHAGGLELRDRAPYRRPDHSADRLPVLRLFVRADRAGDAGPAAACGALGRAGDGVPVPVDRRHDRADHRGVRDLHRHLRDPRRLPGKNRRRLADHRCGLPADRAAHRRPRPGGGYLERPVWHDLGLRRRQRGDHRHLHHSAHEARRLSRRVRRRGRGGGLHRRRLYAADHGRGRVPARGAHRDELLHGGQDRRDSGDTLLSVGRVDRLFPRRALRAARRIGRRTAALEPHRSAHAPAAADPGDGLSAGDRRLAAAGGGQDHRADRHVTDGRSGGRGPHALVRPQLEDISRHRICGRRLCLFLWRGDRRAL